MLIPVGIKRKDVESFCNFINTHTAEDMSILLDDLELFEAKKNAFYGVG